jgi:transcriptional regulator with XRE-family HTH domain
MNKIAKARKDKGVTQKALAEAVGRTQGAVAHWETGRRQPPVPVLRKVAEALGVQVAELI